MATESSKRSVRSETQVNEEKQKNPKKKKKKNSSKSEGISTAAEYEAKRAQRIRENMERMKSMGILDLSKQLKGERTSTASSMKKKRKPSSSASALPTFNDPPRRSSRLQNMDPVCYSEMRSLRKEDKLMKDVEIYIGEGSNPEVYTEEHEKLLGDSKTSWTLNVDGYDKKGQRIYDPVEGKSCHQCRQKTMGHRTKCSKCKLVHGQYCGDCLYMRYGENILEVNENPNWICPVCRGICNCSRCRREKGWAPTGAIYRKVDSLTIHSSITYLDNDKDTQLAFDKSEQCYHMLCRISADIILSFA